MREPFSIQERVTFIAAKREILSGEKIKFFDGKIHPVDSSQDPQPRSQFFEFWIKLPQQQKQASKLVGLFAYSFDPGDDQTYTIINPISNCPMGVAKVEVKIHQTEEKAKIWLAKSLTNESIRVLLRERIPFEAVTESNPSVESLVPDKPHEDRPSQSEDILSPPPDSDDQEEIKESCQAPVLIAPPKFSAEPSLPPPQIVTFPLRPEPVRYSAAYSMDSLEFDIHQNGTHPEVPGDILLPPIDQSVDSLTSLHPTVSSSIVSPSSTAVPSMVHILELSIEGPVDSLLSCEDALGYFVCYNFPGLKDQEVCSRFSH
jgi:hypothetical protein